MTKYRLRLNILPDQDDEVLGNDQHINAYYEQLPTNIVVLISS